MQSGSCLGGGVEDSFSSFVNGSDFPSFLEAQEQEVGEDCSCCTASVVAAGWKLELVVTTACLLGNTLATLACSLLH